MKNNARPNNPNSFQHLLISFQHFFPVHFFLFALRIQKERNRTKERKISLVFRSLRLHYDALRHCLRHTLHVILKKQSEPTRKQQKQHVMRRVMTCFPVGKSKKAKTLYLSAFYLLNHIHIVTIS